MSANGRKTLKWRRQKRLEGEMATISIKRCTGCGKVKHFDTTKDCFNRQSEEFEWNLVRAVDRGEINVDNFTCDVCKKKEDT